MRGKHELWLMSTMLCREARFLAEESDWMKHGRNTKPTSKGAH